MSHGAAHDKKKYGGRYLFPVTGLIVLIAIVFFLAIYIAGLHYFLDKYEGGSNNFAGIFLKNIRGSSVIDVVGGKRITSSISPVADPVDITSTVTKTKTLSPHNADVVKENEVSSSEIDDTITAVVQCSTTQGNLTIDVRGHWSPLGADQYLKLVRKNLFDNLPFFRVCPRYITQFGAKYWGGKDNLHGIGSIRDDPSLWGVRDMDFGYLFFAGAGPNTRHSQMVVALCEYDGCIQTQLGKAQWEVPVGTIREEGFSTLNAVAKSGFPYPRLEMSGQHPKAAGPDQYRISSEEDYLRKEYPNMEYWTGCHVVRENIAEMRPYRVMHKGQTPKINYVIKTTNTYVRFTIETPLRPEIGEALRSGNIIIEVIPIWSPKGAQRFLELTESGFFNNCTFFRVIKKFIAQFGIAADPEITATWRKKTLIDDPVVQSNTRGTLTFAHAGENSRSTQIFINFGDNAYLDKQKFSPFRRIIEGLDVADSIYNGYGESGTGDGSDGKGPAQHLINKNGNFFLETYFPKLSFIKKAEILDAFISKEK